MTLYEEASGFRGFRCLASAAVAAGASMSWGNVPWDAEKSPSNPLI